MGELVGWLGQLPPGVIYLVTALLVIAETGLILGLIVPGEPTLLLVGFLAATGLLDIAAVLVITIASALLGDALAVIEGRHLGPHVRTSAFGRRVGQRRWDAAIDLVRRYGGRAIFVGRFIAFARTLVPRVVAMSGLRYRDVVGWDLLGVTAQVGGSVMIGFLAGRSYERVAGLLGKASGALLALAVMIIALVWFGRYLGANPDPAIAVGERVTQWRFVRALDRGYLRLFRWLTVRVGASGAVGLNLLAGVGLLLAVGVGLTWAVGRLVSGSGLPLVDEPIARWLAGQRGDTNDAAATVAVAVVSVLRASYLVVVVGLVGLLWYWRRYWQPRRRRADLLGILGTIGAFLPLVILAFAVDWVGPPEVVAPPPGGAPARLANDGGGPFANQITLVTASLGMLAWLATRTPSTGAARAAAKWTLRVAVWTTMGGLVLLLAGARLYLGLARPSGVLTSLLLGGLWVMIFAVAWRTRDRVRAGGDESDPAR